MLYISGLPAFAVTCELESCGLWNIPKSYFLDEEIFKMRDSEKSPFGNWGIEKNKLVPYREFCTYDVANHVRAYVDLLYEGQFEVCKDLFFEAINNAKCRLDIFTLVNGKLRGLPEYPAIFAFMDNEFGNAWHSYLQSVKAVSDKLEQVEKDKQDLARLQAQYTGAPNKMSIPLIK